MMKMMMEINNKKKIYGKELSVINHFSFLQNKINLEFYA
jgi:hypothetical protein